MPIKMKPCPFCGNAPSGVTGENGGNRYVECKPCGILGPVGYKGWTDSRVGMQHDLNVEDAIKKWNKRAG
jgi:Lar family restriction alleviation protein